MRTIKLRITDELGRAGGSLPLSALLLLFERSERALAELQVYSMAKKGWLRVDEGAERRVVLTSRSLRHQEPPKIPTLTDAGLVATIPLSLRPSLRRLPFKSSLTDQAFETLLGRSRNYLKLCLPFPEEAALSRFAGQIQAMSARGVRVKLLTREVLNPSRRSFEYAALLRSVLRLWEIYGVEGGKERVQVRDFHSNVSLEGTGPSIHYESTHAKIIISDGIFAYVGSAEFRLNSLLNNFELGFVLSGGVQEIEALFDLVWNAATPVTYDQVRELAHPPGLRVRGS